MIDPGSKFETLFIESIRMKFVRHATMSLKSELIRSQFPFRTLTLITCLGLFVGYGSVATAAAVARPVAILQDEDHPQHVVVELEEHQLDADGNIEVIMVQEGESSPSRLLEKFDTNHNVTLHRLDPGQDGNVEVIVTKGDEQDGDVDLHGHLVELLHGPGTDKINHQELARKLRDIAHQLEGQTTNAQPNHKLHQKIEIHEGGEHEIHAEKLADVLSKHRGIHRFKIDSGGRFLLKNANEPRQMIIELESDNDSTAHAHEGVHEQIVVHDQEQHSGQNIIVEKIHEEGDDNPLAAELRFGTAETTGEEAQSSVGALRAELQQLRNELNQLRSKRDTPRAKRKRRKEDGKTGLNAQDLKTPTLVLTQVEKESEAGSDSGLVWVQEEDSAKSGNRFIIKNSNGGEGKTSPHVIRFDRKKNAQESKEK